MTTHDQQTEAVATTPTDPEFSSTATEVPAAAHPQPSVGSERAGAEPSVDSESAQAEPPVDAQAEPSVGAQPTQPETVPRSAEVEPSDDESLFAAEPSGLRSRWDDIQAAFVDDPSGCVQKADSLVEEVIEQLTSRFADTRSHLEAQWARGETASTEDLRVALTRYREFFQRLLAV